MPFNDKTATVVPSCVVGKLGLNSFEGGTIDHGGMLAGMGLAPVDHLADVEKAAF